MLQPTERTRGAVMNELSVQLLQCSHTRTAAIVTKPRPPRTDTVATSATRKCLLGAITIGSALKARTDGVQVPQVPVTCDSRTPCAPSELCP